MKNFSVWPLWIHYLRYLSWHRSNFSSIDRTPLGLRNDVKICYEIYCARSHLKPTLSKSYEKSLGLTIVDTLSPLSFVTPEQFFRHRQRSVQARKLYIFQTKKNGSLLQQQDKLTLKHHFWTFFTSFLKISSWNIVVHCVIATSRMLSVSSPFWHKNIVSNKWVNMSLWVIQWRKLGF